MPNSNDIAIPPAHSQVDGPEHPPIFNVPLPVVVLVGVLVGVHAIIEFMGADLKIWTLYALSFIPLRLVEGDLAAPAGSQIWTFLTYAFLHGDWFHLASNCLWLVVFATPVARRLGGLRTMVLLALTAIAGAAAMLPLHWGAFLIVVGASGAVSGAMAAAIPIMFAPGFKRQLNDLSGIAVLRPADLLQARSAVMFALVFFGLQIFTGVGQVTTGTAFLQESVIAWEAHVGGFLAGILAFYILDRKTASFSE